MKIVLYSVFAALLFCGACRKESMRPESVENENIISPEGWRRVPRIPKVPLVLSRCIFSYRDLTEALGTARVTVRAVILANGVVIQPGADLNSIVYEAEPGIQPNSLFDSKLSVEWRFPGGGWQMNIATVWSLGCVFEQAGQPPFTNLIRGGQIILINSCFFWGTNVYPGERIAYIVTD